VATNLYCVADQCFVTPSAGTKASSLPKAVNRVASGSEVEGNLTTWYGGSGNVVNRTVNASGVAENQSYYFGRFSSLPLAAQTFPAQNWNWAVIVGEGASQANTFIWPVMYVWRPSNNTVVGYIFNASAPAGSEIAATPATATRNFAGASVTCEEGDLLVVEAWMSGTPSASAHLQTWRLTDKASFIASPYTILFKPQTDLWVTSATATVTPTAGTKASNLPLAQTASAAAGELVLEMTTPPNDTNQLPRTVSTLANTNPQSGFYGRFSTGPLAAQTIPVQAWGWELSVGETNASANIFWWPVLYVWRPSNNTVVGYIFNATGPVGEEWYINADPKHNQIFTGASVTAQDGDILVVEVWGAGSQGAATSYGPTMWINSFNSKLRSPYVIQKYVPGAAIGTANLTEGSDTVSSTATVFTPPRTATSTMTEAADTVSATAVVVPFPVRTATLAVTEAGDSIEAQTDVVSIPKISTLIEDFEAPVNPAKWDATNVLNGTTVFNNGYGEFTVTSTVNGTHASLISVENFSLKDSAVYYKIVRPPRWTADVGGGEFSLAVESPGDNRIDWTIYSNGDVAAIKFTNGAWGQLALIDTGYYSKQDTYRWLRTRETAGTTYWESAPTTASNPPIEADWVVRFSVATNTLPVNAGINNVKAIYRLWVSNAAIGAMIQSARIDGFNTAASVVGTSIGTLAVTEAADTISSTAVVVPFVDRVANAALTEANDSLSSTAVVVPFPVRTATLAVTEAADTVAADVDAIAGATLTVTEANDTVVSTATVSRAASASMTEANDSVSSTATAFFPIITANAVMTEAPDTLSATAAQTFPGANAFAVLTEANDTVSSTATLGFAPRNASAVLTEANDSLSSTVKSIAGATANLVESPDTVAATSVNPRIGTANLIEAGDTAAGTVRAIAGATALLTEAADTLSASAQVFSPAIATLAVTEADDTLSATVTVVATPAIANAIMTEAPDTVLGYTVKPRKRAILIT